MNNELYEVGFTYSDGSQTVRKASYLYPGSIRENFETALVSMVNYADLNSLDSMKELAKKITIITSENGIESSDPYIWYSGDDCDNAILVDLDKAQLVIEYLHRPVGHFPINKIGGFAGKWTAVKVIREASKLVEDEEFRDFLADRTIDISPTVRGFRVQIDGWTNKESIKSRLRRRGFHRDLTGWSKSVNTLQHAQSVVSKLEDERKPIAIEEVYKGKDNRKRAWMIVETPARCVAVPKTKLFLDHSKQNGRDILYEFNCDGFIHAMNVCREWEASRRAGNVTD